MSAPIVFFVALAGLTIGLGIGPFVKDERARNFFMGLTLAAVLVLFGAVAVGLWQAWSPWELTRK